jgi:hypothetical protein
MKRWVFYVDGRPFETIREAAAEAERISGEEIEIWRLRKILNGSKGFIVGVPVSQKQAEDEHAEERDETPEEPHERKRSPLMRSPVRGIPPRWR